MKVFDLATAYLAQIGSFDVTLLARHPEFFKKLAHVCQVAIVLHVVVNLSGHLAASDALV